MKYYIFTRGNCKLDWFVYDPRIRNLTPEQTAAIMAPEGYSNLLEVTLYTIQELHKNEKTR